MRKCLVACCACLLAFSAISVSNVEASGRFGRTVARSFTRTVNQSQRSYRQASRTQDRIYRSSSRYAPVSRSRSYGAPVYYGPSHRTRYQAPRSGIYLGSPRSGIYLNF